MIFRDDIPRIVLEACPTFEDKWKEFLDEWKDEPEPPIYLALADFARHLIGMLAHGNTGPFPIIFSAVERMLVEGDDYVKEAATIGVLEALQNTNLHESTEPEQFRPYLKPESEKWWNKLYDFWEKGKLLTEE
jgi:hypothetical protein